MDYIQVALAIVGMMTYLVIAVGAFLVLRQKTKLGYILLFSAFGYDIILTFIRGSGMDGANAIYGAGMFILVVFWFGTNYELRKK